MARTVSARWTGGLSATTDIRGLCWQIGDDAPAHGGIPAPLPTETLLAAVASCFVMALAFAAKKRGVQLPGLRVEVRGDFEELRVLAIDIEVSAEADPELIQHLIPSAERLCYVTNTLRHPPAITARCRLPG